MVKPEQQRIFYYARGLGIIMRSQHLLLPKCKLTEYKMKYSLANYVDLSNTIFLGFMYYVGRTQATFKQRSLSIRCSSALVVLNTAHANLGLFLEG